MPINLPKVDNPTFEDDDLSPALQQWMLQVAMVLNTALELIEQELP